MANGTVNWDPADGISTVNPTTCRFGLFSEIGLARLGWIEQQIISK